jgi:serine protease Do
MNVMTKVLAPVLVMLALAGRARADEEVYQRTLPSTVMVLGKTKDRIITGSGALVDLKRRLVVTNWHVVGDSDEVLVIFPSYDVKGKLIAETAHYVAGAKQLQRDGRLVAGRVVGRLRERDLALIELTQVPKDARALPLAAESAKPGQRVHSIGNPASSDALWVYTRGAVRQVYMRTFLLDGDFKVRARVVETQSPVNHGDSGGPVVNDRGELVAIVQSTANADKVHLVSIFIDVSEVRALLQNYSADR